MGFQRRLPGVTTGSLVLLGALVALLVAACGGSSTLTHAQLVTKADAACDNADHAAAKLSAPGDSYSSLNTYARDLSPIVQNLIGKLNSLKPASSDRQSLQRYIAALRSGSHGLALMSSATSPTQVSQANALLTSQGLGALAGSLGVPACAASP